MCGLFGAMSSTSLIKSELDNVNVLATLSTLRGTDSAGIFTINRKKNNHKVHEKKELCSAVDLMHSLEVEWHINQTSPHTIAGHCRAATVGGITVANAHPFSIGSLMGMHNGTISAYEPPKEQLKHNSDSQELFRAIDKSGLKTALKKGKDGAYALVWVNYKDSTLNFIRNEKRPLYYTKANGVFYWASERDFLDFMIDRSLTKSQFSSIEMFKLNTHYRFAMSSIIPKSEEYVSTFEDHGVWPPVTKTETSVPTFLPGLPSKTMAKAHDAIKGLLDSDRCYHGWGGHLLSKREAEGLLGKGCVGCDTVDDIVDQSHWINNQEYLCSSCFQNEFHKQYTQHKTTYEGKLIVTGEEDISNAH